MSAEQSWETVFRRGFAPTMSDAALEALRAACLADDPRLVQGGTTVPAPLSSTADFDCQGGCALGYAGWQGEGLTTVGEVEEYFAKMAYSCDLLLGKPASCRFFLNWYDDSPRSDVLRELGRVVGEILEERRGEAQRAEEHGGGKVGSP